MVALVLADEALRKFGGDSLAEFVRNHDAYLASLACAVSRGRAAPRARRADGRGQDDGRAPLCAIALGPRVRRHRRRSSRRTPGMTVAEIFATRGRGRVPRARARARSPTSCASPEPLVIACGGGAVLDPENRRALRATRRRRVARGRAGGARGARRRDGAEPCRCSPAAPPAATLERLGGAAREPRTKRPRDAVVDTDGPHRRRGRRRGARGVRASGPA